MKKRLIIMVLSCSAFGALLYVWLTGATVTESRPPKSDSSRAHITPSSGPTASSIIGTTATARTSDRSNPLKMFEAIESTNVPITFWGKIIDPDAHGIGGVKVKYEYTIEHGNLLGVAWSHQELGTGETTTDKDGLFSIGGFKGHNLSIVSLRHEDYQFRDKGALSFDFYGSTASGKFAPDPNHPVLLTMFHKQKLEPLVHTEGTLHVRGDGTPERWNLWEGESDPNGELSVILKREPAVLRRPGEAATWSTQLQIVGGGIIDAPWDEDIRMAPGEGYVDSRPYPDREQKEGVPYRSFYVKTADGKFGRLQVRLDVRVEGATAPCYITSDMNPRPGSRNLEPMGEE